MENLLKFDFELDLRWNSSPSKAEQQLAMTQFLQNGRRDWPLLYQLRPGFSGDVPPGVSSLLKVPPLVPQHQRPLSPPPLQPGRVTVQSSSPPPVATPPTPPQRPEPRTLSAAAPPAPPQRPAPLMPSAAAPPAPPQRPAPRSPSGTPSILRGRKRDAVGGDPKSPQQSVGPPEAVKEKGGATSPYRMQTFKRVKRDSYTGPAMTENGEIKRLFKSDEERSVANFLSKSQYRNFLAQCVRQASLGCIEVGEEFYRAFSMFPAGRDAHLKQNVAYLVEIIRDPWDVFDMCTGKKDVKSGFSTGSFRAAFRDLLAAYRLEMGEALPKNVHALFQVIALGGYEKDIWHDD